MQLRNHRAPWSEDDKAFVGEHAGVMSTAQMAEILGRSEKSIKQLKSIFKREQSRKTMALSGIDIPKGHCLHHINGDQSDNSLRNLWIATHSDHSKIHFSLQGLLPQLYAKGYILFRDGRYVVQESNPLNRAPPVLDAPARGLSGEPNGESKSADEKIKDLKNRIQRIRSAMPDTRLPGEVEADLVAIEGIIARIVRRREDENIPESVTHASLNAIGMDLDWIHPAIALEDLRVEIINSLVTIGGTALEAGAKLDTLDLDYFERQVSLLRKNLQKARDLDRLL